MAELSSQQIHILRHSLGLTYGDEIYRNYFCTNHQATDWPVCMALVEQGLMVHRKGSEMSGYDDVFFVTDAGKRVACQHQPKLTLGQQRYREWLKIADVYEISFGDWLKSRRTKPTP